MFEIKYIDLEVTFSFVNKLGKLIDTSLRLDNVQYSVKPTEHQETEAIIHELVSVPRKMLILA